MSLSVQVVNNRTNYINGLKFSWVSATALSIDVGACSDSTNIVDIINNNLITLGGSLGAGGLDTGVLAINSFYYAYLIGSSRGTKPVSATLSLSATAPKMLEGYDCFRRIGVVTTDTSAQFLKFYCIGTTARKYFYDVPRAVPTITATTSWQTVSLLVGVPPVSPIAKLNWKYTPAAAGNALALRPTGSASTGQINFFGPVASQPVSGLGDFNIGNANNTASIDMLFTNASDGMFMYVTGFEDYL